MKRSLRVISTGILSLTAAITNAQSPVIVYNNYGMNLYSFNGNAYFSGTGQHPYFSDGTGAGTIALDTSSANDNPDGFYLAGNNVYFSYNNLNPGNGLELWKTNGAMPGTSLVKRINQTPYASSLGSFTRRDKVAFGNTLVFTADDGSNAKLEPYVTDGTAGGTHMIANVQPTINYNSGAINYTEVNNKVVYFTCDYWTCGTGSYRVWAYNGSTNVRIDGGFAISGINAAPAKLFSVGTTTYFGSTDGSGNNIIYQTDGNTFTFTASIPKINGLVTNGSNIFTEGFDIATGFQLYKMDMNFTNLVMVKQINTPTSSGHNIFNMTVLNNTLYFFANDSVHGIELWKSDGTSAGTTLVKDIYPGTQSSYPTYPFNNIPLISVMCNKLWFNANDSIHGQELWVSDGTTAGTQMVADISQGTSSSEIQEAAMSNGRFYFVGHDSLYNYNLYKIDECFSPFSVKDLSKKEAGQILIYPNPSSEKIHIESDEDIKAISVFDILGSELKREQMSQNVQQKDITLPAQPGVYLITIETGTTSTTKKVIRD